MVSPFLHYLQFSTLSTAVTSQYKERNAQLEAALRATVEEIEYRIPAVTLDGIQSDITSQVNVPAVMLGMMHRIRSA